MAEIYENERSSTWEKDCLSVYLRCCPIDMWCIQCGDQRPRWSEAKLSARSSPVIHDRYNDTRSSKDFFLPNACHFRDFLNWTGTSTTRVNFGKRPWPTRTSVFEVWLFRYHVNTREKWNEHHAPCFRWLSGTEHKAHHRMHFWSAGRESLFGFPNASSGWERMTCSEIFHILKNIPYIERYLFILMSRQLALPELKRHESVTKSKATRDESQSKAVRGEPHSNIYQSGNKLRQSQSTGTCCESKAAMNCRNPKYSRAARDSPHSEI